MALAGGLGPIKYDIYEMYARCHVNQNESTKHGRSLVRPGGLCQSTSDADRSGLRADPAQEDVESFREILEVG